jgi:hypothetical protein
LVITKTPRSTSFGNWPEIVGVIATLAIIALMIGLADGTL